MSQKREKEITIPAVGIVDNIVFSNKEAWAYYKIATVPYDFLSGSGRVSVVNDIMVAFASLVQRAGKNVDIHILVTSTPFNVDSWEEQIFETYELWNKDMQRLSSLDRFVEKQAQALREGDFKKRVTYLGVRLFTRGSLSLDEINIMDFGFAEAFDFLKKSISSVLMLPDENIVDSERKRAKREEEEIYRAIRTGALRGQRVSSEELLLVMKKTLYPSMPSPYLEVNHDERIGLNDIVMETGAIIEDHRRYLNVKQMVGDQEMEGYRATLSFSSFPDGGVMGAPYGAAPFLYKPAMMGLPFTMNARMTLLPVETMRKDLQKKKLENKDEIKNIEGSGQGYSSSAIDTYWDIQELDRELSSDRLPWLSGSYRMTVEAPTHEILSYAIQEIKQEYAKYGIIVTWTSGDQLDLMMEEMPGGQLSANDFVQLTNLAMIAVSGFNFGGTVGDPIDEQLVISRKEKKR